MFYNNLIPIHASKLATQRNKISEFTKHRETEIITLVETENPFKLVYRIEIMFRASRLSPN